MVAGIDNKQGCFVSAINVGLQHEALAASGGCGLLCACRGQVPEAHAMDVSRRHCVMQEKLGVLAG